MERETSEDQSQNRVVDANGKFAKGNRSGGRPKGSKNRLTVTVKEMILGELEQLGSEQLHQWALGEPNRVLQGPGMEVAWPQAHQLVLDQDLRVLGKLVRHPFRPASALVAEPKPAL